MSLLIYILLQFTVYPVVEPVHPVMGLSVGRQVPCRQVRASIKEAESLEEPVQVSLPTPLDPYSVDLFRVTPKLTAWMTSHNHHIGHIVVESHAVKKIRQGVKQLLNLGCPR